MDFYLKISQIITKKISMFYRTNLDDNLIKKSTITYLNLLECAFHLDEYQLMVIVILILQCY